MTLFENKDRTCTKSEHDQNQSIYDFFNDSPLSYHSKVRELLNTSFSLYDEISQKGIIDDILEDKNDDEKFYSTCFELIVSYIFRKIGGYTLEPHPQLPHSNKKPDFLVRTPDGDSFYLELVTVGELDNSQTIRTKEYIKKLKHTLNGENKTIIHTRNVEGRELSRENITELHNEIPKWWNKNKQNIGARFIKSLDRSLICLEIVFEDSSHLESIINITNFHNKFLDSLEKKATRYGKLNLPFMVATAFRPSNFSVGLFL